MEYSTFLAKVDAFTPSKPKSLHRSGVDLGGTRITSRSSCIRFIETHDRSSVMDMFSWSLTPHGETYWRQMYHGDRYVTLEDEEFVQALLDAYPE